MENDPRNALRLAFQNLDTFSVPGVGTFRRSYFPASIDREKDLIHPPGTKFVHESGEKHVGLLEDFYQDHFKLDLEKARELVSQVKLWMVKGLKGGGRLTLKNVGTLELTGGKILRFDPEESLEAQDPDFFGLGPVPVRLPAAKEGVAAAAAGIAAGAGIVAAAVSGSGTGDGKETGRKSKEKAAEKGKTPAAKPVLKKKSELENRPPSTGSDTPSSQKPVLEKKNKAEAAAAVAGMSPSGPDTPPEPPPRKRRGGFVWFLLALLFIGGAISGYIWQDELKVKLAEWGIIGGGQATDTPDKPQTGDGGKVADGGDKPDALPVDTVKVDLEPDLVLQPGEEADLSDIGAFATAEQYYLVVGSTHDPADARRLARELGGKVIRPRYKGNYYRIYVAQSADKDEVIAKMVAAKDKHSKSWIYWLGM